MTPTVSSECGLRGLWFLLVATGAVFVAGVAVVAVVAVAVVAGAVVVAADIVARFDLCLLILIAK